MQTLTMTTGAPFANITSPSPRVELKSRLRTASKTGHRFSEIFLRPFPTIGPI